MRVLRLLLFIVLWSGSAPCWGSDTGDLFGSFNKQTYALVVKVAASDKIVLEDGRRVKLIGIESLGPPPVHYVKLDDKGRPIEEPVDPTISLQEQALMYAQNLMENKKVRLEYDVEFRDSHGDLTAYVYLPDGRMANCALLSMGFVKLRMVPPNIKYEELFDRAYQEAKKEKRGLESEE